MRKIISVHFVVLFHLKYCLNQAPVEFVIPEVMLQANQVYCERKV